MRTLAGLLLAGTMLAGCAGTATPTPTSPAAAVAAFLAATPVTEPPSIPATSAATPSPTPKPTPKPAHLIFGKITYLPVACSHGGYASLDFTLGVRNTGGVASDSLWLDIGDLGAVSSAHLGKTSWAHGVYIWDESILSDHMGHIFVGAPRIGPGKSTTLTWSVLVTWTVNPYSVTAYAGPANLSVFSDLGPAMQTWGPLQTQTRFC